MISVKPELPDRKKLELEYESRRIQYEHILYSLQKTLSRNIQEILLYPTIKGRVKSFASYYNKLLKRLKEYDDPDKASLINDILGLRIVCPFNENLKTIEAHIKNNYKIIESEDKASMFSFKEFGYASVHYILKIPDEILNETDTGMEPVCEVQLCTTLQDAWADVEHELVYKAEFTPFDEPLKRKLAALNAISPFQTYFFRRYWIIRENFRNS